MRCRIRKKCRVRARRGLRVSSAAHCRARPSCRSCPPSGTSPTRPTRASCMTAGGCRAVVVYEDHTVMDLCINSSRCGDIYLVALAFYFFMRTGVGREPAGRTARHRRVARARGRRPSCLTATPPQMTTTTSSRSTTPTTSAHRPQHASFQQGDSTLDAGTATGSAGYDQLRRSRPTTYSSIEHCDRILHRERAYEHGAWNRYFSAPPLSRARAARYRHARMGRWVAGIGMWFGPDRYGSRTTTIDVAGGRRRTTR